MKSICQLCGELEEGQLITVPPQDGELFGMEFFAGHKCMWKIGKSNKYVMTGKKIPRD